MTGPRAGQGSGGGGRPAAGRRDRGGCQRDITPARADPNNDGRIRLSGLAAGPSVTTTGTGRIKAWVHAEYLVGEHDFNLYDDSITLWS